MSRESAKVPRYITFIAIILVIVAGTTTVRAQQPSTPPAQAQQQPEQPGGQEAPEEESTSRRRSKPRNYDKWTFNVGGGASLTNGTTQTFVKGGGAVVAAGVARNYSRYFGLRADFQWDNLPLRTSALRLAQAPGASSHVYSIMVDPIVNIPVTKQWGGYVLIGPAFFHRSGKLDSSTAVRGSGCNEFFDWWGTCFNGSIPLTKDFLSESQNSFGFNMGGGITRKITSKVELYGEFRYLHGSHSNNVTALRPITIGVRF